ncbi:ABC transporter substrate-binding protein [Alkalihalobacillus trypoxylicola]|uniref:Myristoyl transferase n=1 Tax=Alkalihalobacillus trypoxylicola TaxID=519424 RepID=A0A162DQK2_9BACI|nr:ABC transporter substrate-binding protein [Alkalihalobacillus trypoxylicola]KYG30565.1 myristoyl transferase [Alkalihalobacillus trypoxylicola]
MKRNEFFLIMISCVCLVLAACGDDSSETTAQTSEEADLFEQETGIGAPEQTDVTLRLNWKFKGEFAPLFITKEKGFFEEYGLNVEVLEGNGAAQVMQGVSQGNEEFGITSTIEPAQGRVEGMPIKMIASYMSRSPFLIVSYPDNPVETPKDLEGKSISLSISSSLANVFPNFLAGNGVDESKVQSFPVETSARNALFFNKEVDAIAIFSSNEYPIFEKELGLELTPLYMADYGFDLASLTVISNEDFLEENPNTVKRFLAALDKGFAYTFENPEEAAEISVELFPDATDIETTLSQIERLEEIALFDGVPFGWMSEEKMETTLDILEESLLISERYDLADYYTNEFLLDE